MGNGRQRPSAPLSPLADDDDVLWIMRVRTIIHSILIIKCAPFLFPRLSFASSRRSAFFGRASAQEAPSQGGMSFFFWPGCAMLIYIQQHPAVPRVILNRVMPIKRAACTTGSPRQSKIIRRGVGSARMSREGPLYTLADVCSWIYAVQALF